MLFQKEENRKKYILEYYSRKRAKNPPPSFSEALSLQSVKQNAGKGVFMLWPIFAFQSIQVSMRAQQGAIAQKVFPKSLARTAFDIYRHDGAFNLFSKGAGVAAGYELIRYATLKALFVTHCSTMGDLIVTNTLPESLKGGFSAYTLTCMAGGVYGSLADLIMAPGEAWKGHNTMREVPGAGVKYDARLHGTFPQALKAKYQAGDLTAIGVAKAPFRGAALNLGRQSVNTATILATLPVYECGAKYALGLEPDEKLSANMGILVKLAAGFTGALPGAPFEAARVRKYMPGSECNRGVVESLKDLHQAGSKLYLEVAAKAGQEVNPFKANLAGLRYMTAGLPAKILLMSIGGASKALLMEKDGVSNLFGAGWNKLSSMGEMLFSEKVSASTQSNNEEARGVQRQGKPSP